MARPYANDLRRKFLQAYAQGKGTLGELAEQFGVSEGWAKKISATRTRTGQIERPPWRHGPVSRVTVSLQQWIGEQIRKQPDLTLLELQEQLQAVQGVGLSMGRLWLALREMGLRLKKSHSTPRNKKPRKRSSADKRGAKP
jgi:transposase